MLAMRFAENMIAVAVGWQVFSIDRNPLDLGLVGLCEFIPLPLLALPAGQLADRVPRRLVLAASLLIEIAVASLLVVVSLSVARQLWPFLALAAAAGVAGSLGMPAGRSLPAMLVPLELIAGAMALRSVAFQAGIVAAPAIGGALFTLAPEAAYGTAASLLAVGLVCALAVREPPVDALAGDALGMRSVLAGIRFIRRTPMLLGAISLDLFAVLFGG